MIHLKSMIYQYLQQQILALQSRMSVSNIRSFIPIQKLGEGSFASVYKVKRISDNKIYALKKIKLNRLPKKAKQNSLNEVRLLASFDSPYITRYYQAFFDQNLDVLCIVMEYADGGDLRKMINQYQKQKRLITQMEIWKVMIHLLYGLKMLHDNKILHRDIKCQNILISDSKYKIGDMNVSKINKEGFVQTQTGTPYYASPEVWKDEPYNEKSDIWSLGCIIYEMAALRPPFMGESMQDLYKCVLRGKYPSIPKCYSNQLNQIIKQCLRINPNERPLTSQLLMNKSLKIYENICIQSQINQKKMNVEMLKTINLPRNIKQLNKCLPKSNYETILEQKQQKNQIQITKKEQIQSESIKKIQSINTQNKVQVTQSVPNKIETNIKQQNKVILQNRIQLSSNKENIIHQKMLQRVRSYSKKIESTERKQRRVLKDVEVKTAKKRSRSRSLPRTQRKSLSHSKELTSIKQLQAVFSVNIGKQSQKNSKQPTKQGKPHYWHIISQAKKYLQRGLHKNGKIF